MISLVFAWVLLICGIIAGSALIIYTEYGRDVSIRFSVIMVITVSLCIGFSINLFLTSMNI